MGYRDLQRYHGYGPVVLQFQSTRCICAGVSAPACVYYKLHACVALCACGRACVHLSRGYVRNKIWHVSRVYQLWTPSRSEHLLVAILQQPGPPVNHRASVRHRVAVLQSEAVAMGENQFCTIIARSSGSKIRFSRSKYLSRLINMIQASLLLFMSSFYLLVL